jgi:vacuolar-type H+-ATPase subunit H
MKKILIVLLSLILLFAAAAIIIPLIYKKEILETVDREIEKNIQAKVAFSDVHLNLLRSFPHLSLELDNFEISGIDQFEFDTLLSVPKVHLTFDLLSVFSSKSLKVIKLDIRQPRVFVKVNQNGQSNYDILPETEPLPGEVETPDTTQQSGLALTLQKVSVHQAHIIYQDKTIPVYVELKDLSHNLRGNLSGNKAFLNTFTEAANVYVNYDGMDFLNQVAIEIDADIRANFDDLRFDFDDNRIRVNDVGLKADGFFRMLENGYDMDLNFSLKQDDFKPLLSLIPSLFMEGYETLESNGRLDLSASVKGIYNDKKIPAYSLNATVSNGSIQYPELPETIEDIALDLKINNPTGRDDDLVVDLKQFSMKTAGNPTQISLLLKHLTSDPYIKADIQSQFDLTSVHEFYPVDPKMDLRGDIDAKINLKGALSAIETKNYDNFTALGYLLINDFHAQAKSLDLNIRRGQFNFSPEYVDMTSLQANIGKSDLYLRGKLNNLPGFFLNGQTLSGNLDLQSEYLNTDELMTAFNQEAETNTTDDNSQTKTDTLETTFEIPPNIDFHTVAVIKELLYDNLLLTDIKSDLTLKDQKLILNELKSNALGGIIDMEGQVATPSGSPASVAFKMALTDVSIKQTAHTFMTMKNLAPIAQKAAGNINFQIDFSSLLNKDMTPKPASINGSGLINARKLTIEDVNSINQLATSLKINELKNLMVEDVRLDFKITDGNLYVKPFDMKLNGMVATLGGKTGLDKSIDYDLHIVIPREKLGSEANEVLENIAGQVQELGVDYQFPETLNLGTKITGTLSNPQLSNSLKDSKITFKDEVNQRLQSELNKQQEKLQKEKEAQKAKILQEAQQQADNIVEKAKTKATEIKTQGKKAADKLRMETDNKTEKMVNSAASEGMLAKLAAEKTAGELKKKGYEQANQIEAEANRQAENLIKEAQKQADSLLSKASKKAEKL